jgi:hypothetical protein
VHISKGGNYHQNSLQAFLLYFALDAQIDGRVSFGKILRKGFQNWCTARRGIHVLLKWTTIKFLHMHTYTGTKCEVISCSQCITCFIKEMHLHRSLCLYVHLAKSISEGFLVGEIWSQGLVQAHGIVRGGCGSMLTSSGSASSCICIHGYAAPAWFRYS